VILPTLLQQRQFGSEFDQHLCATHALTLRLLWVEAEHIALAPLAITDPYFFDLQVVGDLFVAARLVSTSSSTSRTRRPVCNDCQRLS
jgi:hypothetical protein